MSNNICVVGAGNWGKNHIRTLHELGVLGGIVDNDKILLDHFKDKYPYMIMDSFNVFKWVDQIQKILDLSLSAQLIETFRDTFSSDKYCSKLIDIYNSTSKILWRIFALDSISD